MHLTCGSANGCNYRGRKDVRERFPYAYKRSMLNAHMHTHAHVDRWGNDFF